MSDTATPALQVENLSIGFDSDDGLVRVVEDVNFTLDKGKTLSLAGESGCGWPGVVCQRSERARHDFNWRGRSTAAEPADPSGNLPVHLSTVVSL